MDELALINDIKHEPFALLAVAVVLILRGIDLLVKYAPQWITKEKIMPLKEWQNTIITKISDLQGELKKVAETLMTHDFLLNKTSEGTLVNQLFSENITPFIRLKAFRRLLAMGKNGRVWEKGLALVIKNREYVKNKNGENVCVKDVWLDVLDTELGIEIIDVTYYEARLKEIRRSVYNDNSEK